MLINSMVYFWFLLQNVNIAMSVWFGLFTCLTEKAIIVPQISSSCIVLDSSAELYQARKCLPERMLLQVRIMYVWRKTQRAGN